MNIKFPENTMII